MVNREKGLRWAGGVLIVAGVALVAVGLAQRQRPADPVPATLAAATATRTSTPEPIVPTRTPTPRADSVTPRIVLASPSPTGTSSPTTTASWTPRATGALTGTAGASPVKVQAGATATPALGATPSPAPASPTFTVEPTEQPTPTATAASPPTTQGFVVPPGERFRLGVSLPYGATGSYDLSPLKVGWVMDWGARASTSLDGSVQYIPSVRMYGGTLHPEARHSDRHRERATRIAVADCQRGRRAVAGQRHARRLCAALSRGL